MLIIDETRINELKDYGFKPKYDENTGELIAYNFYTSIDMDESIWIRQTISKRKTRLLSIFKHKHGNNIIWEISKHTSYFSIDILYELIKAGLVKRI